MSGRMIKYTEQELIWQWRMSHGWEIGSGAVDSVGERQIEALVKERLRLWYANELKHGVAGEVPTRDLKLKVTRCELTPHGALRLQLPDEGYRLLEVKLYDWQDSVFEFHKPNSAIALRQYDPWLRATVQRPVAILQDRILTLYGVAEPSSTKGVYQTAGQIAPDFTARIEKLIMTAWPEDGSYEYSADKELVFDMD